MTDRKKVIIIMPAYNVARMLQKTVSELPKNDIDEIIVIDDGSNDDTAKVAHAIGLTVIKHEKNKGYGAAQKTGYRVAIERNADIVVMVHGDNQYDPSLVSQFIAKIRDGNFEAVTGTRMVLGDALTGGMPLWKYIPNKVLTYLENFVFSTSLTDYHNGYRAYAVSLLKKIPLDLLSDKFDFDTDIIIQLVIRKCRIVEIPIPTRYKEENSQMSFSKGMMYGLSILYTVVKYVMHKAGLKNKLFEILK